LAREAAEAAIVAHVAAQPVKRKVNSAGVFEN